MIQIQIQESVLRYNLTSPRDLDIFDDRDDRDYVNVPGGNKWITPFPNTDDEVTEGDAIPSILDDYDTEREEIDPDDPGMTQKADSGQEERSLERQSEVIKVLHVKRLSMIFQSLYLCQKTESPSLDKLKTAC